ncbi:MAG: biotin--[acetyl-CoA-carboxylase] ligase [Methylacidiphilales bacterium]|nr:biotin--[acetyl-CoA-carboxylase] ligase [Candidatus Methylacidiphilales bacterium]
MIRTEHIKKQIRSDCHMWHFSTIDSTNLYLRNLTMPGLHLCIAEYQTSGRGRYGARWYSDTGKGLLMSLKIPNSRPADTNHTVSQTIPQIVLSGISERLPEVASKLTVKLPNDIVTKDLPNYKKLAGILIETEVVPTLNDEFNWIIGIGCNIYSAPDSVEGISLAELQDQALPENIGEDICITWTNEIFRFFGY